MMRDKLQHTALCIDSTGMGTGDPALCTRLLESYLRCLVELESAPQAILLYAEGVKNATRTATCRPLLDALAGLGSRIILCRTCLAHYELLDEVPPTEIGNMLQIIEAQTAAARVLKP
jgi:hypothetical protein